MIQVSVTLRRQGAESILNGDIDRDDMTRDENTFVEFSTNVRSTRMPNFGIPFHESVDPNVFLPHLVIQFQSWCSMGYNYMHGLCHMYKTFHFLPYGLQALCVARRYAGHGLI